MELQVPHRICNGIFNHTLLCEFHQGKLLLHLTIPFEEKPKTNLPSDNLKYYRQRKQMTTRQLAEKMDIVPSTVVMYENGKHPIPYNVAIKLADVLEIEASLLYDDFSRFLSVPYTEALKSVRTALGLSQKAFAERIGLVPSYSYLESLPEEKCMVQRLYEIFRTTRSIQTTAKQMSEEGFHTPSGAAFNASTTRLVLRNPIYCTADKRSYDYFIDHDGNVFGDMIEFDGTHGLSAYNKTDQEKYEGSDSTFISPKYVQTIESKPVSEWIIAVGRHEGFIPSEQWIEVQELLDAIAEKYNRPHRKTNALLAGLAHCPHCGRRLSVISESDRWTNGKPRFKYVCPGYRKKECNFKAVDGVLLDEFVVQQLSELSDENSERFRRILEIKIEEVLEQSQTVQEHNIIKKKRDKLKADIAAQTRNLREADGSIKQFIQEDLQNLAEELRETERQLSKLDEGRKNNMIAIRDLEMTKERLLSFAEYAKDAQPEVLVTLIQTIVERIYIVDKDKERFCHIFIKGCTGEDYTGFFQTAGYIEHNSAPVCDSEQYCICTEIPQTDNILGRSKET